jgi:uncharacterized protein YukE
MSAFLDDGLFPYPGDDPAAVRQAAADLRAGRQRLDALVAGLEGSLAALMQSWQGADAQAARTEVTTLVTAVRELAGRADSAVAAVDRHGDDLERIRRAVDGVRTEWTQPDEIGGPSLWGHVPPGADTFEAMVAGRGAAFPDLGADRLAELQGRWRALVQQQEESASTCRSALAESGGGSWRYSPGSGAVRGDLASAIGVTELTFDDRLDAAHVWSTLTADEQALYTALGDDDVATLLGADPATAAQTWRTLDPMVRQALIHARPEIGTVDGLPVEDRDQANRIRLPGQRAQVQAEIDDLRAEGFEEGYLDGELEVPLFGSDESHWLGRMATARARLNALDDIAGSLSAGDDAHGTARHTYRLALDVADRGRIAIAYGNPDTADQVITLVPGTGSDLGGVLGDGERTKLMMQAAEQSGAGTVAGVVWTDWVTPPTIPNAALASYADHAVNDLGDYAEGLRSSHEGDQPFRSVIAAHSYGTVLTTRAASGYHTLAADALILLGSPGTDLDTVRDVRLTGVGPDDVAGRVFATSSEADVVGDMPHLSGLSLRGGIDLGGGVDPGAGDVTLGFSGDPTSPDWGATVFHTPANHSLGYYTLSDHGRYWDPESPQLMTIGDIIADRYHGSRW